MLTWELMEQSLDWIEEHLSGTIEVSDLAEMTHISSFYYQRLFKKLTGKTVMEYVKLRRLARSGERLRQGNESILQIALESGFGSHEDFSRSFKRYYGLTPSEYRKSPRLLNHFVKPSLQLTYTLVEENCPLLVDHMILEVTRKTIQAPIPFVGLSAQCPVNSHIDYCGELWGEFSGQSHKLMNRKPGGMTMGLSSAGSSEGYFEYFVGAEVLEPGPQAEFAFEAIEPGEYIVCRFEAEDFDELVTAALERVNAYMRDVWLPRKQIRDYCEDTIEIYIHDDVEYPTMERWYRVTKNDGVKKDGYRSIGQMEEAAAEMEIFSVSDCKLIGKSVTAKYSQYGKDVRITKLWEEYLDGGFGGATDTLPRMLPDMTVAWSGEHKQKSDEFTYFLGVLVAKDTAVPDGLECHSLPDVLVAKGELKDDIYSIIRKLKERGYRAAFNQHAWNMELYADKEVRRDGISGRQFSWLVPCVPVKRYV